MSTSASRDVIEVHRQLTSWLREAAFPLWWEKGADHARGGFHEALKFDTTPLEAPRRARLHPRQIGAFSHAAELGWPGPAIEAVSHALEYFRARYRRDDGLYRALVAPDGAPMDDRSVLYDQAFALFGFARAYSVLRTDDCRDAALALFGQLHSRLRHRDAGFYESDARRPPLLANSHMHLLESALAWMEVDPAPTWPALAEEIVTLALRTFFDPQRHFVREYYSDDWMPVCPDDGADVEPGHQFEWATLLLRWSRSTRDSRIAGMALDLISRAERDCVDVERDVAFNTMRIDGSVCDRKARLWPQAERLRAACAAFGASGDPEHWSGAARAGRTLLGYLRTPVRGLWYDTLQVNGDFMDDVAPASSFYHLVTAIAELDRALARPAPGP